MLLQNLNPPNFRDLPLPPASQLAGLAALAQEFKVSAPVRNPTVVSNEYVRGGKTKSESWTVFDKRYWPGESLGNHLTFALKHETIDLLLLKKIFQAAPPPAIEDFIRATPSGTYTRKVWYLYEVLLQKRLNLPDLSVMRLVEVLDSKLYFTGSATKSSRHQVRDNLLGTHRFCPILRRTPLLESAIANQLGEKAKVLVGQVSPQLIARAANFLLLADSRASFAIEGERPARNSIERWGRAIAQAGRHPLALSEIKRLHQILIGDTRFIALGLRPEEVFLGEREDNGDPLPEFIGARAVDLPDLLAGWLAAHQRMSDGELNPVLQAAAVAFGFVYIHPLEDGNGRLHRYLLHHVLSERGFTPPRLIFPVSSVMLERLDLYQNVLRAHSGPLMNSIQWEPSAKQNVTVLNDTADLYRYYDATAAAEFIYGCVEYTVNHSLAQEIRFLKQHDEAVARILARVEMPDQLAKKFIVFVRQNDGKLASTRREGEFEKLSDQEVTDLEAIVQEAFGT